MQVSLSTRHGHLSEASQAKIVAKAEKLLRIFDRLTSIAVVVDLKDDKRPQVDLQVSAEHKHDFVASEKSHELVTALDAALGKMEQQLRKYKEKVQEKNRDRDARRVDPSQHDTDEEGAEDTADE